MHSSAVLSRLTLLFVACQLACQTLADYLGLLHTISQRVGGGNFTRFELHDKGNIRLVLDSVQGDADLYISDTNTQPDWTDYELNSVTCGEDIVEVPLEMKRPVYIGVFGHPSHDVSHYNLFIYHEDSRHYSYSNAGSGGSGSSSSKRPHTKSGMSDPKDNEESLLWNIFVGILKILLDILV